jgi:hypothetical protein
MRAITTYGVPSYTCFINWAAQRSTYAMLTSIPRSVTTVHSFPYVDHLCQKAAKGEPLIPVRICKAMMLPETSIEEVLALLNIANKHKAANDFVFGAAITRYLWLVLLLNLVKIH